MLSWRVAPGKDRNWSRGDMLSCPSMLPKLRQPAILSPKHSAGQRRRLFGSRAWETPPDPSVSLAPSAAAPTTGWACRRPAARTRRGSRPGNGMDAARNWSHTMSGSGPAVEAAVLSPPSVALPLNSYSPHRHEPGHFFPVAVLIRWRGRRAGLASPDFRARRSGLRRLTRPVRPGQTKRLSAGLPPSTPFLPPCRKSSRASIAASPHPCRAPHACGRMSTG
jgi:hypothetical protein